MLGRIANDIKIAINIFFINMYFSAKLGDILIAS